MTNKSIAFSVPLLAMFSMNTVAYEMLRHNPFEQPGMDDGVWTKAGSAAATGNLELRGTVVDGPDSMANISGGFYRLNHEVSGYRVIQIETGSVTLSRGGIETILTLHNDE